MLSLCLAFWAAASPVPQLSSHTIDLRQKGYAPPPKIRPKRGEYYPRSRLVTAYSNGNIVAGFVTREGEGLATRESPTLTLHALTFDRGGNFLSEAKFPTTMYDDNELIATAAGELLVRTPEMLAVWSRERGAIAKRAIPDAHMSLQVSPDREVILLQSPEWEVQILSARDLSTIKSCTYPRYSGLSLSNRSITITSPWQFSDPHQHMWVNAICGPNHFEFGWNFPTGWPLLLDETRFLIEGPSTLELVDRDVLRWRLSLGKGERYGWPIEPDEQGSVFAVSVAKSVGGSVILDINGHLKWLKIVIYRAADGERTAELVVEHPPRRAFYFFALSADGSALAVLSDGFLQIAELHQ